MMRKLLLLVGMAFLMTLSVGCCPLTKSNISIALDKTFQDRYGMNREVKVDLICVKPAEDELWANYSMTKYWESSDTLRTTPLIKTLTLNSSKLEPQIVSSDDPKWKDWFAGTSDKHAPKIYVLVQLPKTFDPAKDDKPGVQDPRRQVLSTKSCETKANAMSAAPTFNLIINADRISKQ